MRKQTLLISAITLAGAAMLFRTEAQAVTGALTLTEIRALAGKIVRAHFPRLDPVMLTALAWIESHGAVTATRAEAHISDKSIGLMQTLWGTARWLYNDLGYRAYALNSPESLYDPATSMYFGAAYLDYLSKYRGVARGEEFMIRGYNGGPNGINLNATKAHWNKYLEAKELVKRST